MRTTLIAFTLFLVSTVSLGQEPIITGTKVRLKSKVLGEDYSILISLPRNYEKDGNTEGYPVLYVLDGSGYLNMVSEAVKILSAKNGNGVRGMPECIVVGVTSNNRERDMSPKPLDGWLPPSNPMMDPTTIAWGGADKYLEHIESEVIKYVESTYRTRPYRIIMGHSLAGLLAYHAMITKPQLFQTYLIGDPSVWWNDGKNLRNVMAYWKSHPDFKTNLVLFRGAVPKEAWFPVNIEFLDFMNTSKPAGVNYKYIEIQDDLHTTMVFPGVYFAMRDIFKGYRYRFHKDANIKEVRQHYDSLSRHFGYTIPVSEELFDVMQSHWVHQGRNDLAIETCNEWIKDYPMSVSAKNTLEGLKAAKGK